MIFKKNENYIRFNLLTNDFDYFRIIVKIDFINNSFKINFKRIINFDFNIFDFDN